MELNRVQLLVHNDVALNNKFRIKHDIPNDVHIERSEPNEDANLVEGNGPYSSSDMADPTGLRFSISPMLKEVMARCHLTLCKSQSTSFELCSRWTP